MSEYMTQFSSEMEKETDIKDLLERQGEIKAAIEIGEKLVASLPEGSDERAKQRDALMTLRQEFIAVGYKVRELEELKDQEV
jgi:hypothetical protein